MLDAWSVGRSVGRSVGMIRLAGLRSMQRFHSTRPPIRESMQSPVNDYAGVLRSLASYFDALHHNDANRMKEVWHKRASLRRASGDGGVTRIDAASFLDIVAQAKDSPASLQGRQELKWLADRVVGIDFASPETAAAKVEVTLGTKTYTDHLALLRLSDGWKIVAKLFASRPAASPGSVDTTPHDSSAAEIGAAVANYFSARRNADASMMGSLLHPTCQLLGARRDTGALCEVERDFFVGRTGGVHKPTAAGVGASKWDRLVSIDKSGPDTALAKLHIGYFVQDLALDPSALPGDRMFTDYLHMIRVAGGWRIVARIYTASDAAPSD